MINRNKPNINEMMRPIQLHVIVIVQLNEMNIHNYNNKIVININNISN